MEKPTLRATSRFLKRDAQSRAQHPLTDINMQNRANTKERCPAHTATEEERGR